MKKLLLLLLVLTLMAGCGHQSGETGEPEETTLAAVSEETADRAEELICGESTIEDIPLYYQENFPEQEIFSEFCDLDGNGWGDLAVWYDHGFRALYLMGEDYLLENKILFPQGFLLMECWRDGTMCEANLVYTIEEENGATIYRYYDVKDGNLHLWEALKYDGTGERGQSFALSGDDWVPIPDETYREKLGSYLTKPDHLKPIDEYYLR